MRQKYHFGDASFTIQIKGNLHWVLQGTDRSQTCTNKEGFTIATTRNETTMLIDL